MTLSIEKGDADWEAELLAAYHRLSHVEKTTKFTSFEDYLVWEKYHRAFNRALISACGLKHLLSVQEKLYQLTERYRRIWFLAGLKAHRALPFSLKQKQIMDASLARNLRQALKYLEKHYAQATKLIELTI